MLAADELPLDQKLPIDLRQLAHLQVERIWPANLPGSCSASTRVAQNLLDLGPVGVGRPRDERKVGQVPRQPDAAAEMTMSDSGPEPRSHSPLVLARSSRFMEWIDVSTIVASR